MPRSPRSPAASSQSLTTAQKQQLSTYYNAHKALNPSYTYLELQEWPKTTEDILVSQGLLNLNCLGGFEPLYHLLGTAISSLVCYTKSFYFCIPRTCLVAEL